ncbi:MAG TPA: twin-arginine translocase TatA/TatE family subunit [Methylocystis sp.]|nr:twin-arginine translocase TatA/TatE family subunit [Methylocystis sp.]
MGGMSIWHWIVVGVVVFVFFGGKFKISDVMGDVAKGIKAFKKGLNEPEAPEESVKPLDRLTQEQVPLDKTGDAKKV